MNNEAFTISDYIIYFIVPIQYFAGEVHATTVIKDDESNLIQIVSRGNMFNNFLKVIVEDSRVQIESYNEIGSESRWNNNHELNGHLMVDKSSSATQIDASGIMDLVDKVIPIVHFDFEEIVPLKDRQILGMVHDDFTEKLVGDTITMRGIKCTNASPNQGSFGRKLMNRFIPFSLVPFNLFFFS